VVDSLLLGASALSCLIGLGGLVYSNRRWIHTPGCQRPETIGQSHLVLHTNTDRRLRRATPVGVPR
jgi:hypothetical protein